MLNDSKKLKKKIILQKNNLALRSESVKDFTDPSHWIIHYAFIRCVAENPKRI